MEIWVYNQVSDQRDILKVTDESIMIGRDTSNDVVLQSPFVSRKHARIFFDGGSYYIESLGMNEVIVANTTLPKNQRRKIGYGDEVRLGEFSLYMMEPSVRRISAEAEKCSPRKLVNQLEKQIHAELLDRLNLRVTASTSGADSGHARLIKENLQDLISNQMPKITDEMGSYMVREFLWRIIMTELARKCTGRLMYSYGFEDTDLLVAEHEDEINRVIEGILSQFVLIFKPTSLHDDLKQIENNWDRIIKDISAQLDKNLREYILRRMISKDIEDVVFGYGPLQDLLEMPNINEIMVVGKDKIYIEKDGVLQNTSRSFFSEDIVHSIIERIITPIGRRIDRSSPLVDARLADGSRVNAVINPLSLSGPVLTIRKFASIPFTIDDIIERQTLSEHTAAFLKGCITGRKNIIISGGTGSGKTTTLNVLSHFISAGERIITIEDSAELQLPHEHLVRLETRPANIEGQGAFSIRDLVRNALRMRPDRLIIGECRGPEALDMLQAMNTGHDGSLTTIHANSPQDTIMRLETMVLMAIEMPIRAIREQIVSALDIIVQISRQADGSRRVTHISEISEIDPQTQQVITEDIFVLRGKGAKARLEHTGYIPPFTEELISAGHLNLEVLT